VSSEPYELDAQNLENFFTVWSSTKRSRELVDRLRRGGRGARKNWIEKIEISKFKPSLVDSGKIFGGFWLGASKDFRNAHWLMCEQNEAGVLSTVSPPVGAEWGLSKNSPLPHSKIWGWPPFKKILFCGDPHLLQVLKISLKNFCPFLRIFFKFAKM